MNTRYLAWAGMGAVLAFALAVLALAPPASAINDPPGTGGTVIGDWIVTDYQGYSSVSITMQDGNLTVQSGGTLSLSGVTLMFSNSDPTVCNYTFKVESGGSLLADNACVITSTSTAAHYIFAIEGSATINGSSISEMWGDNMSWAGGIQIYSDSVSITNCTVFNGMTGGISIFDCSPVIANNNIRNNGQDGASIQYCFGIYARGTRSVIESNALTGNGYTLKISETATTTATKTPSSSGVYWNGNYYYGWYRTGTTYYCYRYDYNYYRYYGRWEYYGTGLYIDGGSAVSLKNNRIEKNGYGAAVYSYSYQYQYLTEDRTHTGPYGASYWYEHRVYLYQYRYIYNSVRCYATGLHIENSTADLDSNYFDRNGFEPYYYSYPTPDSAGWYAGVAVDAFNSDLNFTNNTINNAAILVNLTGCRANFTGNTMLGDYIGTPASTVSAQVIPWKAVWGIRCNHSVVQNLVRNSITIQYKSYPYLNVNPQRCFAESVQVVDLGVTTEPVLIQGNRIIADDQYYGACWVRCINTSLNSNLKLLDNYIEFKRTNAIVSGVPDTVLLLAPNRYDVYIDNCTFKAPVWSGGGNVAPSPVKTGSGIFCYGVLSNYRTNLTIVNCSFTGCDYAAAALAACDLKLSKSAFATSGYAIQCLYATKASIRDVSVSSANLGLQVAYSAKADLYNVSFRQCNYGVQVTDYSQAALNTVNITGSKTLSLLVDGGSKATLDYCTVNGAMGGLQAVFSKVLIGNSTFFHAVEFILDGSAAVDLFNSPHTRCAVTLLDNASRLNVYWPVRLNVNWQNDVPVEGASVLISTFLGEQVFSGTTDGSGSPAPVLWVRDYTGRDQVITKFSPFRITCAKGRATSTDFYIIDQQLNITYRLIDNIPPDLQVTFPFDGQRLNFSLVTFSGTATDPEAGLLEGVVEINIDNAGWTALSVEGPANSWSFTRQLGDGVHVVRVKAVDLVGNLARASLTVSVDTMAPVLQVFTPKDGSSTNQRTVTITGITEENAFVTVNGIGVALEKRSFRTQVSLLDGPNTIAVTSSDASGNSRTVHVRVTVDTAAPPLEISSPVSGAYTNQNTISVMGTTEPSAKIRVNGVLSPVFNNAFEALVELSEGANTITVTATDLSGNTNTRTILVNLDTSLPDLSLFTPRDQLWTNSSKVLVTGATEQGATVTINGQNVNVLNTLFSGYVSLLEGANRIEVVTRDPAGNTFSEVRTIYLDTRIPDLILTSPPDKLALSSRVVLVFGSVDWGTEVLVNGEPVAVTDFVFSTTAMFGEDGSQIIEVVARDLAGNTAIVTRTVIIDTVDPTIYITYPVEGMRFTQRMITVSGQVEPFSAVVVNTETLLMAGRDGLFSVPVQLEDGNNRITIKVTDAAGNTAVGEVTVIHPVEKVTPKTDMSWALNLTGLLLGVGVALPIATYLLTDSWRRRRTRVLAEIEEAEEERRQREAESARLAALPKVEKMGKRRVREAPAPPKEATPPAPPKMAEPPKPEAAAPEVTKLGLKDKSGVTEAGVEETDQATKMEARSAPAEGPKGSKPEEPESDLKDKGSEAEHKAGETELPAGKKKAK